MKFRKDFIGLDGFIWWIGVVENRLDPLGLGRCQVRCFGFHDKDLALIPSEDLPWAQPVTSVNSPTFSTPKEGDYVFGFFLDGRFAQTPVMLGVIPGIPSVEYPPTDGFTDLRTEDQLTDSPKKPASVSYSEDGYGAEIEEKDAAARNPEFLNEPTNSRLARNENVSDTVIELRRKNTIKEVISADDLSWAEPFPAYNAKYPFNKVMESESGHVLELDDTPGDERVHLAHRSGTFQEIYPTGTKVEKIVKNNYRIVLSDDHLYVVGKVNITVASDANIRVVGNINLQGENDLNAIISGDSNISIGGDLKIEAQNIDMLTGGNLNIQGGNLDISADSNIVAGAGGQLNMVSGSKMLFGSGGQTSFKAITSFDVDAISVNLKKGRSSTPKTPSGASGTGVDIPPRRTYCC
jgi:hypothetical protein